MKRRGNKSNKVPGVKLRPAEKGAFSRSLEESCWAEDTQAGSDDTTLLDLCPRPFKGVVICATGVPDKLTIFKQAVELGATCTPAFTDRVTHLVAVSHGGAKYMCALERKIPMLKPSWVMENYQVWLRGDDVDILKSIEHHRLPIFSGVVLCPSGISDITRRTQINKFLVANEGTYLKNLERPVRVTHLLCSGDEETDKMRYAEKFNSRGEAKIHLVWEEWFWDSLDFGGRFDEAKYQVRQPRPERKTVGEISSSPPPPPSSGMPSQYDEGPSSASKSKNLQPQPLQPPQNSILDELIEDEKALPNFVPDATLLLWSKLLERRGYQITNGEVILSPSKADGFPPNPKKSDMPTRPSSPPHRHAGESIISSFRRANSFAPVVQPKDPGSSRQLPFRRSSSSAAGASAVASSSKAPAAMPLEKRLTTEIVGETEAGSSGSGPAPSNNVSMIFTGMVFRALGEAKCPNVRQAVDERGGRMSTDPDGDVDFVIVRLVSGSKLYREEDDLFLRAKYRTECWLEQCIYEDRICEAEDHISFVPLAIDIPISGAERITMSLSGFDQSQVYRLKRLLRALGINIAPTFSRRATHLLCPSGTGLKFEKACEWDIPVVNVHWLAKMAESGQVPGLEGFLVSAPTCNASDVAIAADRMVLDEENDLKGKGKAIEKGKERVPSSNSPSPMKSLQNSQVMGGSSSSRLSVSPVKIDHEVTKALQESITSLLGKRPSPEREDLVGGVAGLAEIPNGRNGKRARPHRSKPQTRQGSTVDVVGNPSGMSTRSRAPPPVLRGVTGDLFEPYNAVEEFENEGGKSQEESMRVMYEDPGQRDEKKRLISLLKGQGGGEEDSLGSNSGFEKRARRSMRIAGF